MLCKLGTQDFWAADWAGILLFSAAESGKKSLTEILQFFAVFSDAGLCLQLRLHLLGVWDVARRACFSYLSVLYGSSDLHWCCVVQLVIGEHRKLLASFSFRKLSVWVISQFLLRSWSSNVLWFHAFHRDNVVWFPFFFYLLPLFFSLYVFKLHVK